jgi:four helix bundle protein
MFRFEKLGVWQKAVGFADRVYAVTREFPDAERFGLTSQMRRAAVSISSNVAEGSGRMSDKDFAHFVEVAYGSLMEVVSQSQLALNQEFLKQSARDEIYARAEELARMLSGLRSSLLHPRAKDSAPPTLDPPP